MPSVIPIRGRAKFCICRFSWSHRRLLGDLGRCRCPFRLPHTCFVLPFKPLLYLSSHRVFLPDMEIRATREGERGRNCTLFRHDGGIETQRRGTESWGGIETQRKKEKETPRGEKDPERGGDRDP